MADLTKFKNNKDYSFVYNIANDNGLGDVGISSYPKNLSTEQQGQLYSLLKGYTGFDVNQDNYPRAMEAVSDKTNAELKDFINFVNGLDEGVRSRTFPIGSNPKNWERIVADTEALEARLANQPAAAPATPEPPVQLLPTMEKIATAAENGNSLVDVKALPDADKQRYASALGLAGGWDRPELNLTSTAYKIDRAFAQGLVDGIARNGKIKEVTFGESVTFDDAKPEEIANYFANIPQIKFYNETGVGNPGAVRVPSVHDLRQELFKTIVGNNDYDAVTKAVNALKETNGGYDNGVYRHNGANFTAIGLAAYSAKDGKLDALLALKDAGADMTATNSTNPKNKSNGLTVSQSAEKGDNYHSRKIFDLYFSNPEYAKADTTTPAARKELQLDLTRQALFAEVAANNGEKVESFAKIITGLNGNQFDNGIYAHNTGAVDKTTEKQKDSFLGYAARIGSAESFKALVTAGAQVTDENRQNLIEQISLNPDRRISNELARLAGITLPAAQPAAAEPAPAIPAEGVAEVVDSLPKSAPHGVVDVKQFDEDIQDPQSGTAEAGNIPSDALFTQGESAIDAAGSNDASEQVLLASTATTTPVITPISDAPAAEADAPATEPVTPATSATQTNTETAADQVATLKDGLINDRALLETLIKEHDLNLTLADGKEYSVPIRESRALENAFNGKGDVKKAAEDAVEKAVPYDLSVAENRNAARVIRNAASMANDRNEKNDQELIGNVITALQGKVSLPKTEERFEADDIKYVKSSLSGVLRNLAQKIQSGKEISEEDQKSLDARLVESIRPRVRAEAKD